MTDILEPAGSQQDGTRLGRRDVWVLAGFLLFLLVVFSPVLFGPGEVCLGRPGGDARSQFYGWRAYGFGEVRMGRFPLWNPHEFLGMPFVASLQSAMFYPTNWLCAVLPLGRAINAGIVINLFLSGMFTYLWCRRMGMGRVGGVVGASAYVFGAPQFLRIFEGHWSFLAPMPWIPCVLLCVEVLISGRARLAAVAGGAAAVAMGLFGGNPQYVFFCGIAAVLYLGVRAWQERGLGARRLLAAGGCFAGMWALGVAAAGVQLVPALELLSVSSRQGQLSYEWIAQYSFVPENLITLIAPGFFGTDAGTSYWGRFNVWEMTAYVGVVAAGLAVLGVARGPRKWVVMGTCLSGVFLVLALGGYTPVLRVLYALRVPGFRLFRSQARFLCPMSLFLGMLAGWGAEVVVGKGRRTPGWAMWGAGVAAAGLGGLALAGSPAIAGVREGWARFVAAVAGLGGQMRFTPGDVTEEFAVAAMACARLSLLRAGMFLAGLTVLFGVARMRRPGLVLRSEVSLLRRVVRAWVAPGLVALVALDVWTWGGKYLQTFDPRTDGLTRGAVAALRGRGGLFRYARGGCYELPPCEGMIHRLDCIEGVQPNAPALFRDVFWSFQGFPQATQATSYSIRSLRAPFRMLNLRYLVYYRGSEIPLMTGARTVYEDERIRIAELPGWWPRAWLVHRYETVADEDGLLAKLQRLDFEVGALFSEDPGERVSVPRGQEARPEVLRYEPGRVVVRASALEDGFLILSDLHYPGWRASVDGRPARIYRANYVMRAVHVPKGEHRVEFEYVPGSFRAGMGISAAGWLGVLVLGALQVRQGRGRKERA